MNKFVARTALLVAVALCPLLSQADTNDTGGLVPIPPQEVNTVPEPGSLALVAMAVGAALALGRRRRSARRD